MYSGCDPDATVVACPENPATHIFVNCGRYIHTFETRTISPHVPNEAGRQPFPAWKRIDILAETLSEQDQKKVKAAGGPIPVEAYPGEGSPDFTQTVT